MKGSTNLTASDVGSILDLGPSEKVKLSRETTLTTLWAGYGTINSVTVTHSNNRIPLIIKRVNPPSNSGSVSNQRKIRSYHIEAFFYKEIAPIISELNESGTISCPIAKPYQIETEDDSSSFTFILSDLTDEYNEYSGSSLDQTKQGVNWLAAFHATFYGHPILDTGKVWDDGGYWHLKTRLDELEEISSSRKMFRKSAYAIDERMSAGSSNSITLVHGDYKDANIMHGSQKCAVVDFQYCGRGYGAKDLVMIVVSSVPSRIFSQLGEKGILHLYCDELRKNLASIGKFGETAINKIANIDVLKMQYELALVDYVRFMLGWGLWGCNSRYAEERAMEILNEIFESWSGSNKKKIHHLTEDDWKEAVYEKYPLDLF